MPTHGPQISAPSRRLQALFDLGVREFGARDLGLGTRGVWKGLRFCVRSLGFGVLRSGLGGGWCYGLGLGPG